MPLPPDSPADEPGTDADRGDDRSPKEEGEQTFAQNLEAVEQDLQDLKQRYLQIQQDQQQRSEVLEHLAQVKQSAAHHPTPALKAELKQIQQRLAALEEALESRLLSWSSLKEVFWQAVRFGGLGVVIGWVLRSL